MLRMWVTRQYEARERTARSVSSGAASVILAEAQLQLQIRSMGQGMVDRVRGICLLDLLMVRERARLDVMWRMSGGMEV